MESELPRSAEVDWELVTAVTAGLVSGVLALLAYLY
jgi:hypothetical protein